jgi:hypothetical protein
MVKDNHLREIKSYLRPLRPMNKRLWGFRDMPLENLHIVSFTYLPDQIPQTLSNLLLQNRLAAFCDPHKVILQVINGE